MVVLNAWVKENGTSTHLGTFLKVRKAVRAAEALVGSKVVSVSDFCYGEEVDFRFAFENGATLEVYGR